MNKVLLIGAHADELLKQVPAEFQSNFKVNCDYNELFDYVVVFERFESVVNVNCGKLIFISGEPDTIQNYTVDFINQFDLVFTTNRNIPENKKINIQYLPWHYGLFTDNFTKLEDYITFTNINKNETPLICGISGNKCMTSGHTNRYVFMNYCKFHFNNNLEVYGHGIKNFIDKSEFMNKYKYQIVIENSQIKDYWTEKIADSFISECFTFYYGCPNIKDYFPENSYLEIDINKPFEAIELMDNAIRNNYFEKYHEQILISKQKVLKEFTFYNYISKQPKIENKIRRIIKSEEYIFNSKKINRFFKRLISNIVPYYLAKKLFGVNK